MFHSVIHVYLIQKNHVYICGCVYIYNNADVHEQTRLELYLSELINVINGRAMHCSSRDC